MNMLHQSPPITGNERRACSDAARSIGTVSSLRESATLRPEASVSGRLFPDSEWMRECLPSHPKQWKRIINGETL